MIRAFRPQDLNPLMSLWLESTTLAHPFISADYWRESAALVRDIYLPRSQTWIYQDRERMAGFISVLESRFIGTLFVRRHDRRGINPIRPAAIFTTQSGSVSTEWTGLRILP